MNLAVHLHIEYMQSHYQVWYPSAIIQVQCHTYNIDKISCVSLPFKGFLLLSYLIGVLLHDSLKRVSLYITAAHNVVGGAWAEPWG